MKNQYFPKILIIGHSFNEKNGLGITLTNLFKEWPKNKIAVISDDIDLNFCENNRPCFSYVNVNNIDFIKNSNTNFKKIIINKLKKILRPIYYKFGFEEFNFNDKINEQIKKTIDVFEPDFYFTCLGSLNSIKFINRLLVYKEKKLVIYIVDDWPNTKFENRVFRNYWKKRYNLQFKELLSKTTIRFSICQSMTDSYWVKYGYYFIPFHNPIDILKWNSINYKSKYENGITSILYIGKINRETKKCILDMCKVVSLLSKNAKMQIIFDIYTPDYERYKKKFEKFSYCKLYKSVSQELVPYLLRSYSILFLPIDFSPISVRYARLSMPTKLTEYLISGIPIFLYCSKELALFEYLSKNQCAYFCSKSGIKAMQTSLFKLIIDEKKQKEITKNSLHLAKIHDISIIRENFRKSFFLS